MTTGTTETNVINLYEDVKQVLIDFFTREKREQEIEENTSSVTDGLNNFYQSYMVETVDGTIQIFQSFTYGELLISFLLLVLVLLYMFKWFWEVLR